MAELPFGPAAVAPPPPGGMPLPPPPPVPMAAAGGPGATSAAEGCASGSRGAAVTTYSGSATPGACTPCRHSSTAAHAPRPRTAVVVATRPRTAARHSASPPSAAAGRSTALTHTHAGTAGSASKGRAPDGTPGRTFGTACSVPSQTAPNAAHPSATPRRSADAEAPRRRAPRPAQPHAASGPVRTSSASDPQLSQCETPPRNGTRAIQPGGTHPKVNAARAPTTTPARPRRAPAAAHATSPRDRAGPRAPRRWRRDSSPARRVGAVGRRFHRRIPAATRAGSGRPSARRTPSPNAAAHQGTAAARWRNRT